MPRILAALAISEVKNVSKRLYFQPDEQLDPVAVSQLLKVQNAQPPLHVGPVPPVEQLAPLAQQRVRLNDSFTCSRRPRFFRRYCVLILRGCRGTVGLLKKEYKCLKIDNINNCFLAVDMHIITTYISEIMKPFKGKSH